MRSEAFFLLLILRIYITVAFWDTAELVYIETSFLNTDHDSWTTFFFCFFWVTHDMGYSPAILHSDRDVPL